MLKEPVLTVSKKSEYFISIGKIGIHTFMMLGVVDKNGDNKLLARVGKANDIEPDAGSFFKKFIGKGTLARIGDEGVLRKPDHVSNIKHQTYSINYEQVKEFLSMIAAVEQKHLANPLIRKQIEKIYTKPDKNGEVGLEQDAIKCYVPEEKEGTDEVVFSLKKLKDCSFVAKDDAKISALAQGAQVVQLQNTCRTSAINMVENILGFTPKVSKHFFISPRYNSQLKGGQPEKETFCIFPSPPDSFKDTSTPEQKRVLDKLYKRMEAIPQTHLKDPKTKAKFEALKSMYQSVSGANNQSASDLLSSINTHLKKNEQALYQKREPGFFSKAFNTKSATETLIRSIKKDLKKLQSESSDDKPPTLNKPK